MIRLAPALLLVLALEPAESVPTPPARLIVESGRATVVRASGLEVRTPASSETRLAGPSHIELAAQSVVRLCWDGRASIVLTGPAAFEWPGGTEVALGVEALAEASVEVRRGAARLRFPGGWELSIESGLTWISEAPGRWFELRRDAGRELTLAAPVAPGWPRPPIRIGTGAHVRFGPNQVFEIVRGGERVWLDPRALAQPGRYGEPEVVRAAAAGLGTGFQWPWNRPEPAPEPEGLPTRSGRELGLPIEESWPTEPGESPTLPLAHLGVDRASGSHLHHDPEPHIGPPIGSEIGPLPKPEPEAEVRAWITSPAADPDGFRWAAPFGVGLLLGGDRRELVSPDLESWAEALRAREAPTLATEPEREVSEEIYSDVPRPGYEREVGPWGLRWRRVQRPADAPPDGDQGAGSP